MALTSVASFLGLHVAAGILAPLFQGGVPLPCSQTIAADGTYYYYLPPAPPACNHNCLDFYAPTPPLRNQTILFLHGGGFTMGDKAEPSAIAYCEAMASLGYHVVSANYTLAVEGSISSATASFPQALMDVKAAVAWIRTDPPSFGLPDCIIAVGNSAGGGLAALLGTTSSELSLAPASSTTYGTDEDFRVDAVVTFAAPTDLLAAGCEGYQVLHPDPLTGSPVPCDSTSGFPCDPAPGCTQDTDWEPDPPTTFTTDELCCLSPCVRVPCASGYIGWCDGHEGCTSAEFFVGEDWGPDDESFCNQPSTANLFAAASAVHWVDANDAPYFGFSAQLDSLVPGNQTELLVNELTAVNVVSGYELKLVSQGCGHGLETLFEEIPCGCAPWEPIGNPCVPCTTSAERAAVQTVRAINQRLHLSCN